MAYLQVRTVGFRECSGATNPFSSPISANNQLLPPNTKHLTTAAQDSPPFPHVRMSCWNLGSMVSKYVISPTYKWDILGL